MSEKTGRGNGPGKSKQNSVAGYFNPKLFILILFNHEHFNHRIFNHLALKCPVSPRIVSGVPTISSPEASILDSLTPDSWLKFWNFWVEACCLGLKIPGSGCFKFKWEIQLTHYLFLQFLQSFEESKGQELDRCSDLHRKVSILFFNYFFRYNELLTTCFYEKPVPNFEFSRFLDKSGSQSFLLICCQFNLIKTISIGQKMLFSLHQPVIKNKKQNPFFYFDFSRV